jgi:predicted dehydrogenase
MSNGAAGTLACSQVAAGEMNELLLRIYGEKGSLEWRQQDPNRLIVKRLDRPEEIHHAAMNYLSSDALAVARVPAGHPEGYLEAFAVLYREFADALMAWKQGNKKFRCRPRCPGLMQACAACALLSVLSRATAKKAGWNSKDRLLAPGIQHCGVGIEARRRAMERIGAEIQKRLRGERR